MDRHELQHALRDADLPILLMVLMQLTGDRRFIEPPFRPVRDSSVFADESGGLPEDVQEQVRALALEVLAPLDPSATGVDLDAATYAEMMSTCVGEPVGDEYVRPLLEEMGFAPVPEPEPVDPGEFGAIVVGAGFSGVCAAIKLQAAGIPYVVLEKNENVGGAWWENTYPEAGVDTPNHFYSFSFAPKRDWTHYFSKQPDILAYLEECVARFGVGDRIRLRTTVRAARWDEDRQRWDVEVETADGGTETLSANALITGLGQLNQPKMPAIDGLDSFAGELFHTSRWPADLDLAGKRVAIVGTGASAMQVARTVAERAASLTIFQRSPQWVVPNPAYHRTVSDEKRWLLTNVPYYGAWYRFALFWRYADGLYPHIVVDEDWEHGGRAVNARNDKHRRFLTAHIAAELDGRPDLLEQALPTYPPYGKRMLIDNDWFRTLRRDDVELVSQAVTRIVPEGVVSADGVVHPCDVVLMATGFEATRMLGSIEVTGADGRTIAEHWDGDDARAHLGITVPDFPNLFLLLGPNTGLGHGGSALFHVESQVRYVVACLTRMVREGLGSIEPRADVHDAYNARVDAQHERMVFAHPGMDNWYKNRRGRVVTLSPWRLVDYWSMTREPDPADFVETPARRPAGTPAG
jgi:4-hydroxyacetophenone monooxygenase